MSRRLIVRAEAEADITEAAAWYEGREPGLGFEFTHEIRTVVQRVLEHPTLYLRLRKHREVHRILARRFPYRIFYIAEKMLLSCSPFSTRHGTTATGSIAYEPRMEPMTCP